MSTRQKMTTDVFKGSFPPASYGQTLEEVEATISQVIERVFRDDDGILLSFVNGRTMKPFRTEEVKDRPRGMGTYVQHSDIPDRARPVWLNYEDTGMACGYYLEALCAKARVAGDAQVREPARRTVNAIAALWENAAKIKHPLGGGGRGWFPKPYLGIHDLAGMHECSADQYYHVTLGLHSYYLTLADEKEKRKIEEIVVSFADWWYDHDYCGVYLGRAIWWKRLPWHTMAVAYFLYLNALAQSWSPCRKFQHGFETWLEFKGAFHQPRSCGDGLACLERLLVLRPDMADYWRHAAACQAKLLVADMKKTDGPFEPNHGWASSLARAHRLLPHNGYDRLARRCLDACSRREHFYQVKRGKRIADLDKYISGDDYRDGFMCLGHPLWLCAYWGIIPQIRGE